MSILVFVPLWIVLSMAGLAVSILPRRAELRLGRASGRLILRLGGYRREVVYDNIRHCFPELGPKGWNDLLERNFEHYGILFFEFLHFFSPLPGHYAAYARRISRIEGVELWKKAADKGKGVIFFSSHVGFWEMSAAAGGLAGIPLTIVTKVIKPKWLHEKITACRLSTGVRAAHHPGSATTLLRSLRRGECAAFMNDQYAGPSMGVEVPFFGVKVGTLAAVAPLALRTGAAILPVSCSRNKDGIVSVIIEPELELGRTLEDTAKTTGILAAKVEGWVRKNPDQWLWIHRRFKNVVWPVEREMAAQGVV